VKIKKLSLRGLFKNNKIFFILALNKLLQHNLKNKVGIQINDSGKYEI
jgi:hypothetical protein